MDPSHKVNLLQFTFHSLYFCGTKVELLRGERFLTAVNHWYMPFIRSGFAVPLSFIIDVSTLLQRPETGFSNRWKDNIRENVRQVLLDYYQMLRQLQRQPIFTDTVDLIAGTSDPKRRDQAIKTFLRFLVAELSQIRSTYAFDTRRLSVLKARPTYEGIRDLRVVLNGKTHSVNMPFLDPTQITGKNEFGALLEILRDISGYCSNHPLQSFISPEEQLMITMAARSRTGISRVDYRFLQELLSRAGLSDVERQEPQPRTVHQIVPTDSYEIEGNVGGYIDVNRRCFSGSLAEILPVELSLFNHRRIMLHKLLNEGSLHFVRENIECIEEELRLLFCFVIDVDESVMRVPDDLHPSFGKGMTPYIRARALAALLIMDLARHLPRQKVQVDFAVYLWSRQAKHTYCIEFDLFEQFKSAEEAEDRFGFAVRLSSLAPRLFENRVTAEATPENIAMDRDPTEYVVRRSQARVYHCRHMVFFTSSDSVADSLPARDPDLHTYDPAGDSLFVVYCDVRHQTISVSSPGNISDAAQGLRIGNYGQLSEDRLRAHVVETVLRKAAGRVRHEDLSYTLGEVS